MQNLSDQKTSYKGLFVTDLDGTLLTDEKVIAEVDLEALQRLRAMGILVVIATGRSDFSFNRLMHQLGYSGSGTSLTVDYVIVSTGAGVMTFPDNRIEKSHALENDNVILISNYLDGLELDYMIHKPVPDTKHFIYQSHGGDNSDFYARLKIYRDYSTPLSKNNLKNFGKATELVCITPAEGGHELAERIMTELQQFSVIKATSPLDGKSIWIEIFPPEVSKSQSTRFLAKRFNIHHKNICAVGNDFNDEDLLLWVEHGYLVSNGPSSMKETLRVVGSNNEGGVREAVNHWIETTFLL